MSLFSTGAHTNVSLTVELCGNGLTLLTAGCRAFHVARHWLLIDGARAICRAPVAASFRGAGCEQMRSEGLHICVV